MRQRQFPHTLLAIVAATLVAVPAFAGPPLVCFPSRHRHRALAAVGLAGPRLEGHAHRLPRRAAHDRYGGAAHAHDTRYRADGDAPPCCVVRHHGSPGVARAVDGVDRSREGPRLDALALFDAGYLVETYKQAAPFAPSTAALAQGIDGYSMVARSAAARGHDPAIEFAAALMLPGSGNARAEHVRVARAGAPADQLLARNITQLGR